MATRSGFLSASKDVVLEIQVNKLINDLLFPGVAKHNAADVGNAGGMDDASCVVSNHADATWETGKPARIPLEHDILTDRMGKGILFSSAAGMSCPIQANASSKVSVGSECMPLIQSKAASLPEEVWLDMPEGKSRSGNEDKPLLTNKLKVFRLSRTRSDTGSLFCFAVEREEQHGDKTEEENKTRSDKGLIKLTRIGSLPCHSELRSEREKEMKHTCRKPPRPPRSSSLKDPCSLLSKHAAADAIFVLHSASRRARLERRKKLAASSRSNASIWALIFTFCFVMTMVGEGFWSQSFSPLVTDTSTSASATNRHTNLSMLPPSLRTATTSNFHVSSQSEEEMQMREFNIIKSLDPS